MKTWWTPLLKKLAPLSQLRSPGQWWLLLRVFAFAAAVPLLFKLRISVLSRVLERRNRSAGWRGEDAGRCEQIIRYVGIAMAVGKPLVRPRCLIRAVTLYYFLQRAGMDLTLCFGAARREGWLVEAAGHCWLIRRGEPFLEERDPRASFVPICRMPGCRPGVENHQPKINTA
jgi:hypothetical protein